MTRDTDGSSGITGKEDIRCCRHWRWALGSCFVVFLISRHVLWVFLNPMFQGPDEVQHLAMVSLLDKYGISFYRSDNPKLLWREFQNSFDFEGDYYHQPGVVQHEKILPQYLPSSRWGIDEKKNLHQTNFDLSDAATFYEHNTYRYPPLYYWTIAQGTSLLRKFHISLVSYQFLTRLIGSIVYPLFLLAFWFALKECIKGWKMELVFLLVIFHPMLIFMTSICNNDNALLPFSWMLIYCLLKVAKDKITSWTWTLTIVSSCGLIFTKGQGILFATLLLFLMGQIMAMRSKWKELVLVSGWSCLLLALYFTSTYFFGHIKLDGAPESVGWSQYVQAISGVLFWRMLMNNIGQFAWSEVQFSTFVYTSFLVFGIILIFFWIYRLWKLLLNRDFTEETVIVVLLGELYLLYIGSMLTIQYFMLPRIGYVVQGRYFLNVYPILCIMFGFFVQSLLRIKRQLFQKAVVYLSIVLVMSEIYLSNLGLFLLVERFYLNTGTPFYETVNYMMQYKPEYFKNSFFFVGLFTLYCGSSLYFIFLLWGRFRSQYLFLSDTS